MKIKIRRGFWNKKYIVSCDGREWSRHFSLSRAELEAKKLARNPADIFREGFEKVEAESPPEEKKEELEPATSTRTIIKKSVVPAKVDVKLTEGE